MITSAIANSLKARALSAYFRASDGKVVQPSGNGDVIEVGGLWFIVLTNMNGILAVYRIREVNGQPVLKGLKRWPKDIDAAFA